MWKSRGLGAVVAGFWLLLAGRAGAQAIPEEPEPPEEPVRPAEPAPLPEVGPPPGAWQPPPEPEAPFGRRGQIVLLSGLGFASHSSGTWTLSLSPAIEYFIL